jgi:hypothetical protein
MTSTRVTATVTLFVTRVVWPDIVVLRSRLCDLGRTGVGPSSKALPALVGETTDA